MAGSAYSTLTTKTTHETMNSLMKLMHITINTGWACGIDASRCNTNELYIRGGQSNATRMDTFDDFNIGNQRTKR
jgi:hypothetical protein